MGSGSWEEPRRRDPWASIDEHLFPVDRPVLGPLIGLTFLGIAFVSLTWLVAVIMSIAGVGLEGEATVTSVNCHKTARGGSCETRGNFVSADGMLQFTDIRLHSGQGVGSKYATRATETLWGDNEPYVGAAPVSDALGYGLLFLLGATMGGAWLCSTVSRSLLAGRPSSGRDA